MYAALIEAAVDESLDDVIIGHIGDVIPCLAGPFDVLTESLLLELSEVVEVLILSRALVRSLEVPLEHVTEFFPRVD